MSKIPFAKVDLGQEEIKAVADVIKSGWVVLGPKTAEFETAFAKYVGAKHAIFVDSATSAMFLALKYLKPKPGTKVLVPSLTFVSTAEIVVNAGCVPIFADVDLETLCLDKANWKGLSIPVHVAGNRARFASKMYDSAHRIGKGDVKGSDAIWCYSLYATKNITTVQGGMICTNSDKANEWLRLARDHGLSLGTKERYQGRYKQYDVSFVGFRFKGDDLRAAIGLEQLKKLDKLNARRSELVKRYNKAFGYKRTGNHLYPILVKDRTKFMNDMMDKGIQCAVHFRPLHTMTAYKKFPHLGNLKNTEFLGEHIVSLPLFPQLSNKDQDHIIKSVIDSGQLM